jgi:hypothetical protein
MNSVHAEIGDCVRRPNEQHTAINIEAACIHGKNSFGHPAGVCGACVHFERRKHLAEPFRQAQGPERVEGEPKR